MTKAPETVVEKTPPGEPELNGLGDVRREMARVYRDMKAKRIPISDGNGLVNALNCLACVMMDARDSMWTKRTRLMWAEREARNAAESQADH